ncbi:MAG: di-trans,poly-cis-decaprenylcistransferase [Betaproteobacteria bacterium]|nr:di-trans,poly-cis-decaprenylcistransferase [Betaproteobacteria bacterium]
MHPLQHVAVIMDGNGRWARQRNLPRSEGHRRGLRAARAAVRACAARQIPNLSLFAFSRENWNRPAAEVRALLSLFAETAQTLKKELADADVRVVFIGQRGRFPAALRAAMDSLERHTANGRRLRVNVAASYSGRWDVAQAAQQIAANGGDFSEENFTKHLSTGDLPEVDLLIRTGGEQRISNFMLWQAAYSELYFTPVLWPDFDGEDFDAAAEEYARRERRFGVSYEKQAC